jgi:hypothetical protein
MITVPTEIKHIHNKVEQQVDQNSFPLFAKVKWIEQKRIPFEYLKAQLTEKCNSELFKQGGSDFFEIDAANA